MRGDACPTRCGPGQGIKHTLPMFSSAVSFFFFSKERCVKCVRHCWRVTTVDPVLPRMQFRIATGKKNENSRESNKFQHLLHHFDSNSTFVFVRQRGTEPSRRTRWRPNGNNVDELSGKKPTNIERKKKNPQHVCMWSFLICLGEGGLFLTSICHEKKRSFLPSSYFW